MLEKTNLSSLGPHFEQSLQSHQQKHKNTDAEIRSRKRNAQLLKDKLSNVVSSRQLARSAKTARYVVDDQKGITNVSFCLCTVGTTLPEATKKLVDTSGQFYKDYLSNGASYRKKDEPLISETTKERLAREHISIYAYLETASDQTLTHDEVYVGTILDPETLLIPGKTTDYIKIGPIDPRFEATLSIASFINYRTKSGRRHIRRPKIVPPISASKLAKKLAKKDRPKIDEMLVHKPKPAITVQDEPKIVPPISASKLVQKDRPKIDEMLVPKSKPVAIVTVQHKPKINEKPVPKLVQKDRPKIDEMLVPKSKYLAPTLIREMNFRSAIKIA